MGQFCQISTEMLPFMFKIGFDALSWPLCHRFLQTLNESQNKYLGVLWDCKSFNFAKKYRVLALDFNI